MVIAHISDLHVSRFGEHLGTLSSRRAHGSPRRGEWEEVEAVDGWRVEKRAGQLRLVDDRGAVHARQKFAGDEAQVRRALLARARARMLFHHTRLAGQALTPGELESRLRDDPDNTNLLFCRVARLLEEDAPDWILLTGDVTDDGEGYDLVLGRLHKFVERRRLLAVPGNHDIYDSPLLAVPRHVKKTRKEKRAEWQKFASALGLPEGGTWVRPLGDGMVVAGLDSCHPPRVPFSASGKIQERDLEVLSDELRTTAARCRLVMLHHHVVNPPKNAVGRSPIQLGLRLRNADQVYKRLRALEVTAVLNGHRHVGYRFHPSHAPMIVASPSTTLGCLSGAPQPYYWRIEADASGIHSVRERQI